VARTLTWLLWVSDSPGVVISDGREPPSPVYPDWRTSIDILLPRQPFGVRRLSVIRVNGFSKKSRVKTRYLKKFVTPL
jgi:hypothetical protein